MRVGCPMIANGGWSAPKPGARTNKMLEFRILGPLEVVDEGGRVALGGQRQRALLALLLLHAGEVRLDRPPDRRAVGRAAARRRRRPRSRTSSRSCASVLGAGDARHEAARLRAPGRARAARPRPLRAARRGGAGAGCASSGRARCARRSRCGAARRSPTCRSRRSRRRDPPARGAPAGSARGADRRRPRARRRRRARRRARGARRASTRSGSGCAGS